MVIKGVIFDLDGTITHTLPLCIRAFREAIGPLSGRTLSDEEIVATFGPSEEGTIRALAPERYEEGIAAYLEAYDRLVDPKYGPFPGITEWLQSLVQSGLPIALVTGKGPGSTAITLAKFDLERFFEHVATGSPDGPVKPSRIREVIEHWSLPPDEVLYVGDAPSDITAAHEVGVRVMSVLWSPESEVGADELRALRPDVLVETIADARKWLDERLTSQSSRPL